VLMSESMDLQLQEQILSNKVHSLHLQIAKGLEEEQRFSIVEYQRAQESILAETISNMSALAVPHDHLVSPFARLQSMYDSTDWQPHKTPSTDDAAAIASGDSVKAKEDACRVEKEDRDDAFLNSTGMYSFTSLFRKPLPPCIGVIKSGR
jgi:uncharacterized protein with von Willebrand factor type A (vWA) domain